MIRNYVSQSTRMSLLFVCSHVRGPSPRSLALHSLLMQGVSARLRCLPVNKHLSNDEHEPLVKHATQLFGDVSKRGQKDEVKLLQTADALLQDTWDTLHATGRSHDLLIRLCYAVAAVSKAIILIDRSTGDQLQLKEALKSLDMALIMSPPLDGPVVYSACEAIHAQLPVQPLCSSRTSPHKCTNYPSIEKQIPIEERIDLIRFEKEYFRQRKPVVFQNAMNHWPSLDRASGRKWSLDYLNQKAGHRTVPIEVGRKYTDSMWTQKLMTLNEFINEFILKEPVSGSEEVRKGYLAQHNLFDQMPELRKDISMPDFCSIRSVDDDESIVETNVWFGPSGTVSPLHFDTKDNILVQVSGEKYVRIYSRDVPSHVIYPHAGDSLLSNTSRVDCEEVDANAFPAFAHFASDFMSETILREGDALFIPCQTWHFVKSLTTSCSVSFWWT